MPGAQLHGSTVAAFADRLFCAWFAGAHEGSADTRVWLASRDSAGGTWGEPSCMSQLPAAHWNPVLATGPEDDLWLFYKVGPTISGWRTWYRRSADGRAWTDPRPLVDGGVGGRGPVRNPPVLLPSGAWVAPASRETWLPSPRWDPFVDLSVDGGATWQERPIPVERERLSGAGLIQPALWVDRDEVVALMRSSEGVAFRSVSADGGRTWSTAAPVALPNGNAALGVAAVHPGLVACVHNPVSQDWGRRCPLAVSVSRDGGRTWRRALVVEDGTSPPAGAPPLPEGGPADDVLDPGDAGVRTSGRGEYSYPAVVAVRDELMITYTWQRAAIAQARVPLAALTPDQGEDNDV